MSQKRVLIIGFVWPEPKSSAAGSRILQLIGVFQSQNYHITFSSPCAKTENAFNLERINVDQQSIKLNDSSFDNFIKSLNPDVVLFDRFMMEEQFGWRVAEYCPNALRILDTEDLHGLRKGRQEAFKNQKEFNQSFLYNDTTKREIASIYRSDLSLIISEVEMEILRHQLKIDKSLLLYLPFMIDSVSNNDIEQLPIFKYRKHFITIGNFLHEPNYNAILYLRETIWPLIRKKLPHAELHIYGAYVNKKVSQLHNQKQGFLIKGFIEDANKVMQTAKVCLAPIRFGAGLKGKLIDAMKNGTPCVTTSIGAEGIFGQMAVNGFVKDNPFEFAELAVKLYENAEIWNLSQANGFQVINERFSKNRFHQVFIKGIDNGLKQITENRLKNFIGQMLQHQSMQSTKFMSRWIEEKNKTL